MRALAILLAVGFVLAAPVQAEPRPTLRQMVGQLLLVRMQGTQPSTAFLQRVERGEVGGVVLFGSNFTHDDPAPVVARLQRAARAGHQPRLLIAIDQEGGDVKRLSGAPTIAPPRMPNATVAKAQGLATARELRSLGINVDLAPVLDVDHGGFIGSRTFGTTPAGVSIRGTAFADGLAQGHVLATAKHFPGLGYAKVNTDRTVSTIQATAAKLSADWQPYRRAIAHGIPLVMVSTAIYPKLGTRIPAATSIRVLRILRKQLGYSGVVVTDALQTPEVNDYFTTAEASVRAVAAGVDLVLAAGGTDAAADTDVPSTTAYAALVAAARSGRIPRATVEAAYGRVRARMSGLG